MRHCPINPVRVRVVVALVLLARPLAAQPQLSAQAELPLEVAFGEADVTPPLNSGRTVWVAGYGFNRPAQGVHDPIMARVVALRGGQKRLAIVSVDVVGLHYHTVQAIRSLLPDWDYVLVASTHNHEGPDTIGIWGRTPVQSGVDPKYLELLVQRVAAMVKQCEHAWQPAQALYGTAADETLLGDSRQPYVFDGVLRLLKFVSPASGQTLGLLVQWNCHPESLGSRNQQLTADFPWATVAELKARHQAPVVYVSGAVGGLMGLPDRRVRNSQGEFLPEGTFEFAQQYGQLVADLADQAIGKAEPLAVTPLEVFAKPIAVPLYNPIYKTARMLGVVRREGRLLTDDFEQPGRPYTPQDPYHAMAVETEVAYLRLGQLHVACIPGELYPELVYGKFQEPADPGADFPDAPLETPVMKLLPGDKTLLIGLANDELGYIIPKRQWDQVPPYAYGRKDRQYGEINSCGPEVAPIVLKALENRVRQAERNAN